MDQIQQIGFRLQYMEVLNWGTFHNKIWRIEPNGNNSLLTGSIGSGKSTLADALTSLIVPHHKIQYNKAAGAEAKERNLASYVKGYYKHEKDENTLKERPVSLRYTSDKDATFTVILANFYNEGYEQNISLAQIFWMKEDKAERLLLIGRKPLSIKNHFSNIGDVAELKKRIKQDAEIESFDNNFLQYSQQFRRYFGMNSDKAIDLFNQTVSMKSVSSLTAFVREQMLEKSDVKAQLEDLKSRFSNLNRAHEAVVSMRRQKEILEPLIPFSEQRREIKEQITNIEGIYNSLPSFFATQKQELLENEISNCTIKLSRLQFQIDEITNDLANLRTAESNIRRDIHDNGGSRLEELERLIKEGEQRIGVKKGKYDEYKILVQECELPLAGSDKTFYSNISSAAEAIAEKNVLKEALTNQFVLKSGERNNLETKIKIEEEELESLRKRQSQIPDAMMSIREQISEDLNIPLDEIPYIAEVLKVRDSDKQWQGAIERLLHGFGLSMMVPEKHYKSISQYVNERRLVVKSFGSNAAKGQRLEYYRIPVEVKYSNKEPDADSVFYKIEIKPGTDYQDWLEEELIRRFNLRCVSLDEFNRQKDVITIEGQIKTGEFRHLKDDRRELWDRKNFVLGWSNKEKINAIEESIEKLNRDKVEVEKAVQDIKKTMDLNESLSRKLDKVLMFKNWGELNWQDERKDVDSLQYEQRDLEQSNDVLKSLQDRLKSITEDINNLETRKTSVTLERGSINKTIEESQEALEKGKTEIESLTSEEKEIWYPKVEERLVEENLTIKNVDTIQKRITNQLIDRDGEKDIQSKRLNKLETLINNTMLEYKKEFVTESSELSVEIGSLSEFLKKWEDIVQQDLPRHEKKFKEELNSKTIEGITIFDQKLDDYCEEIKSKISDINKHLKEIEYSTGTYITLMDDRNSEDKEINDFRSELQACYHYSLGDEDIYSEERFNRVKKLLDKFNGQSNLDYEWTNKVTDVRNWFIFNASERYISGNELKEFYTGSSGKSGGQKEKLAYTILASALAYQFGLSFEESKSKSFRFVLIDEAFGRGDDDSTKFGLGLFKKLNLQLLIVTPLQKIHVIENHVNAVHYVSNSEGNNSQVQNLTIQEYQDIKVSNNVLNGFLN